MNIDLDFTVAEYAAHTNTCHNTARKILYEMAREGLAETLPPRPGHRLNVFRLRESAFKPYDPFGLVKRKVEPSDPNAWMFGAQIT